jgi:hypothetical protein
MNSRFRVERKRVAQKGVVTEPEDWIQDDEVSTESGNDRVQEKFSAGAHQQAA